MKFKFAGFELDVGLGPLPADTVQADVHIEMTGKEVWAALAELDVMQSLGGGGYEPLRQIHMALQETANHLPKIH